MKNEVLDILKKELNLHPLRVLNIYLYGSIVYQTWTEGSDIDLIVIANTSVQNREFNFGNYNIHIQTLDHFQSKLDWNHPTSFECVLFPHPVMETIKLEMDVVPARFRHAVSHISSNSWVKAKKKIEQRDIYIGQKSLWHSIRIPMFATQIMTSGKITDWQCVNKYWDDIKQTNNWEILKDKYQPVRNKIMTGFRKLCEKDYKSN